MRMAALGITSVSTWTARAAEVALTRNKARRRERKKDMERIKVEDDEEVYFRYCPS